MQSKTKYQGLRLIGWLAQVVAWVILLLSVAGALILLFAMRDVWPGVRFAGRNWTGLLLLPVGFYFFLQLYVIGALLQLLTDLEANTRQSAAISEQLLKQSRETASALKSAAHPSTVEMTPPPPPPPPASERSSPVEEGDEPVG